MTAVPAPDGYPVDGNRLDLLRNGEQYFPALMAAIDAAAEEVFLETYIFEHDRTGNAVAATLCRAAARGVRVHVLIDGYGSRGFPDGLAQSFRESGVRLLVFRPERSLLARSRARLRRMHRKLAVIDSAVAFVGGINIIDDFDEADQISPRFDYAVRVSGAVAADVRAVASRLWSLVSIANMGRRTESDTPAESISLRALARLPRREGRVRLVVRDSVGHRRDIENELLRCIANAREEVIIACAYFLPGRRFRRALFEARARGARVVLLLQGRVEYALLHYATRALYDALLRAGIEIHEYHLSFLHAKVAVFDRASVSVGSSNIDPFSLLLAREANLFVDDPAFASELRASLMEALRAGSRPLPMTEWRDISWHQRVLIWASSGLARGLTSFVGVEPYH
jgi:cardiolipin synthase